MTCSDAFNVRSAVECLEAAMVVLPQSHPRFAVLQFGFDGFRQVNETFGRGIGDAVLREAEHRLSGSVREFELVVRLPGDEFAVLLHSVGSVLRAGRATDRLNAILQVPYSIQDVTVTLTASVGMALSPEDGTDAEGLLRRAGRALRCAKDVGSGTLQFFEPAMEARRKRVIGDPQVELLGQLQTAAG